MSNVKPGDFAVVACGPNAGKQVLVLEYSELDNEGKLVDVKALRDFADRYGEMHRVEAMQPMLVNYVGTGRQAWRHAGYKMHCPDAWLRRIDPPPQGEDLWRDTPSDEEMAQALNRAIKEKMR